LQVEQQQQQQERQQVPLAAVQALQPVRPVLLQPARLAAPQQAGRLLAQQQQREQQLGMQRSLAGLAFWGHCLVSVQPLAEAWCLQMLLQCRN
jgi:hypothetical protein